MPEGPVTERWKLRSKVRNHEQLRPFIKGQPYTLEFLVYWGSLMVRCREAEEAPGLPASLFYTGIQAFIKDWSPVT